MALSCSNWPQCAAEFLLSIADEATNKPVVHLQCEQEWTV